MNLQQVEYKEEKPRSLSSSFVDQHITTTKTTTTTRRPSFENAEDDEHNQEQRSNMMMTMTMEETNQYCSSLSGGDEFVSLNGHAGEGGEERSGEGDEESWMGIDKTRHEKKIGTELKSAAVAATKKKEKKKRGSRNSSSRHYHQTMKGLEGLDNDCFSIESTSTISSLEVDLSDAEEVDEEAVMPFRRQHRRSSKNCPVVMRKSERRNSLPSFANRFPSSSPHVLGGDDDHNDFSRFDALSKSERYADSLPELPADLDGSFRGTGLSSPRERAGGCGTAAAATSTRMMKMMKQRSCIFSRRSSVDSAMADMLRRNKTVATANVPNDLPISDKDLQVMDLLSSNIKESRWQSVTTTSTMGGNGSSTLNGCSSSGCILQKQRSSSALSSPPKKESISPDLLANDVQKRLSLSPSEWERIIQQQNLPLVPPKRKPVLDSEEV